MLHWINVSIFVCTPFYIQYLFHKFLTIEIGTDVSCFRIRFWFNVFIYFSHMHILFRMVNCHSQLIEFILMYVLWCLVNDPNGGHLVAYCMLYVIHKFCLKMYTRDWKGESKADQLISKSGHGALVITKYSAEYMQKRYSAVSNVLSEVSNHR